MGLARNGLEEVDPRLKKDYSSLIHARSSLREVGAIKLVA